MSREEHLEWCKQRALEYIERGDVNNAFNSMCSDLGKHEGTEDHAGINLGMLQIMAGYLSTPEAMKAFILGFN